MIDYEKERATLGSLVTVGGFKAWLEGLRKRTDAPGLRTGIDRWIERVGKLPQAKSLASVRVEVGNLYAIGLNLLNQAAGKPAEYGAAWVDDILPATPLDVGEMFSKAMSLWRKPVEGNPERFRPQAEAYLRATTEARANLDAMKPLIRGPADAARFNRLAAEFASLQERFAPEVSKVEKPTTGVAAAVVLVVGIVGLTVIGTAWAVAYHEYAASFRDRTALELEEFRERATASREGRSLQASTIPPGDSPKPPGGDGLGLPGWVLPAAGLAVAGGAAWWFLGRRNDREGEG